MNLLIVDDQKLIADNLRTIIDWTKDGYFTGVYCL